jgi:signal transduction histidine kinase
VAPRSLRQSRQAALARLGVHTPFGRDAAGAALLAALLFGGLVLTHPEASPALVAARLVLTLVGAGGLAWRRQVPKTVLALTVVHQVGLMVLLPPRAVLSPFLVVGAYTVGAYGLRRPAVVALTVATAVVALAGMTAWLASPWAPLAAVAPPPEVPSPSVFEVLLNGVVTVAVPGLVGAYLASRRAYIDQLEQRTRDLARQREERAQRAVAEERSRIARELHDVAAHNLSGMVVHAGAAEQQAKDHPEIRQALADIRAQGSATLAQMRQVIGVLRDEDQPGERQPPPSLARAAALVEQARRAGCDASLAVDGDDGQALPPSVDRAGYRVLQESLANARRHAPAAAVIARLRYRDDALEVEVTNPAPLQTGAPPEESNGHGLAGMRERVTLVGGQLTAGPTSDGGWRVHAVLPTTGEDETPPGDEPPPPPTA